MIKIGLARTSGARMMMHVFFLVCMGLAISIADTAWARDETPKCGGDGQNACWFTKAKKHGSVACRSGEFYDLLTNTCWSCGSGWNRSIFPIKGDKACHKPPRVERKKARWLRAGTACDPKRLEFFDLPTWSCWTCGSGYGRTVFPIKGGEACEKTIGGDFKRAVPKRTRECRPGQFLDARNGGECWSCPAGYNRHITPITADDACIPRSFCDAGLMQYNVHKAAGDDGLNSERYAKCAARGKCGKRGQRPCFVWERLPSCDAGLYENFAKNICEKLRPGENPFFAGLDSFSREAGNVKEYCKKALYNVPFWKEAQRWVDSEDNLAVKAMKADLNCRKDFQIGFWCQSSDIVGMATAPAGIANAITAAWNKPPCNKGLEILTTKASVVKEKRSGVPLTAGCPAGAFWDPIDNGSCWRCPDTYKRHITHIKGGDACIRADGYPQLLRHMCAVQQGIWGNTGGALQCVTKLIGSGRFGDVKDLFSSGQSRPWNTPCTKAGAFGFEAALAVATGGAGAAASAAQKTASGVKAVFNAVKGLYKVASTQRGAVTAMMRVRHLRNALDTMQTISECKPFAEGVEAAVEADPELANLQDTAAVPSAKPMRATGKWKQISGKAFDIGAGASGVYHIGGSDSLYRWDAGRKAWNRIQGQFKRVDVGGGQAWTVAPNGNIHRINGNKLIRLPGKATDIGVNEKGQAWAIGTRKVNGGYDIYRWHIRNWQQVKGGAVRVDVDPKGNAWVVNSSGDIFQFSGNKWKKMPGKGTDITVGGNGDVYVIGTDASLYRWDRGKWKKLEASAKAVSADRKGRPWVVGGNGGMFAWNGAEKP